MPSHLLQTTTISHFLPSFLELNVFKYLARMISSSDSAYFLASITNKIMSDSSIAFKDCWKMSCLSWDRECSGDSEKLLALVCLASRLTSIPGVSMTVTIPFKIVNSLLSLVMPYSLSTMASLSPMRQLKRLLLPQLGKPINDTLNFSVFSLKTSQSLLDYFLVLR